MATYIMLTTLTSEGAHTVHGNPDRLKAVAEEVKSFGCEVIAQYAVLGEFDFVTIVEAPDNETIAHLSVDLGSRGTAMRWVSFFASRSKTLTSLLKRLQT